MNNQVTVAYDALDGRYGIVFHDPTCHVLGRVMGSRTVDRNWAEDRGMTPCYFCFLECPSCKSDVRELRETQLEQAKRIRQGRLRSYQRLRPVLNH